MDKTLAGICFAFGLLLEPTQSINVPHHNIDIEQTRFAIVHEQNEDAKDSGILSLNSKGLFFYENQNGNYQNAESLLEVKTRANSRHWLSTGDFDNDRKEDIVYIINHNLLVHKNKSSTTKPTYSENADYIYSIPHEKATDEIGVIKDKENGFVNDMNKDGLLDIVINNKTGCYVFYNEGNFSFSSKEPVCEFPTRYDEWGIEPCAYDWNNDGLVDVLAGTSEGIFVAINNRNGFDKPEKIAEVEFPKNSSNDELTGENEIFKAIPRYTVEDRILIKKGIVEGKEVPIASTVFGLFAIYPEQVKRINLYDSDGKLLTRLKSANGFNDKSDFIATENKIIYVNKGGIFYFAEKRGKFMLYQKGKVEYGGERDRAYLLQIQTKYVIGTSRKLQFFDE